MNTQQEELCVLREYRRIQESEDNQKKSNFTVFLTVLLFFMSIPWRSLSSMLLWCVLTIILVFSQVGDKSGIVSDKGKEQQISELSKFF